MQLTLTSGSHQLTLNGPDETVAVRGHGENRWQMAAAWGTVGVYEYRLNNACVLRCDYMLTGECNMRLRCNSFLWLMSFVLEGSIAVDTDKSTSALQKGDYYTAYFDSLDIALSVTANTKVLTICLEAAFIKKLTESHLLNEEFRNGVKGAFNNSRMRILLNDVMEAGQSPFIRRVFLEAKILELLSQQLEVLEQKRKLPGELSAEDISRLNYAKDILTANLKRPYSLLELARKCGLNDFKLKLGFKLLYGQTVFGYLGNLRMEKALRLLKEKKSVGLVAEEVGYKNPQHFTAAFKKKYGILPSQV